VVAPAAGGLLPTLDGLQEYCRAHLAGHKVPRQLFIVDKVPRTPSGKADYDWAKGVVASGTSDGEGA
jgi:acyl-CoA synthetase (AMP-forming)/AMP-acid ligase II